MLVLGYQAFVNDGCGSIFLSHLCKNLEAGVRNGYCQLWDLVTVVNRRVSEHDFRYKDVKHVAQCPEVVSTMSTPFWFKKRNKRSKIGQGSRYHVH